MIPGMLSLLLLAGCKVEQEHPGQFFEFGTGLKKPAGVKELQAQNVFWVAVGESYYLKWQGDEEWEKMLETQFTPRVGMPENYFGPDFKATVDFWNPKDFEDDVFFEFNYFDPEYPDREFPTHITYVAFDPKTRLSYIACEAIRE